MVCPECKTDNPPGTPRCRQCNASLDVSRGDITTTGAGIPTTPGAASIASGWSIPPKAKTLVGDAVPVLPATPVEPGMVLGGRYEILQLLGEGGMGSVFKARDTELDRLVAIKVIRPELAGRAEILQRFKQELILARKVTHRNVIRIFDLGQADGIKFITMEYVEGLDLKHHLKAQGRKLEPKEAAEIMRQVCLALEAAHAEGVIHRDLKPGNVMIEHTGRVLVMDFGIARSMESTGMTQTGMMVGTPEYMSPEQAKGERLDPRSDLFTFGIIFYELLTGHSPYESETAIGTLMRRMQERAKPPIELNAALPRELSDIVVRCLTIQRGERYQSATEILQDVNAWLEPESPRAKPPARVVKAARYYKWAAAGLAALLLAVVGLFLFRERTAPRVPGSQKAVTVLVADFQNTTGDAVFDGSLEPMFTLALEGAAFVSTHRRSDAMRVANQIRPGAAKLDEALARLVAGREGINVVVSGSIGRSDSSYTVAVKAVDAITGRTIATEETRSANKDRVLATVGRLAAPVRKALGDATPESAQLAAAESFTTASLEAAQNYAQAQELRFGGKIQEALQKYMKAIELDPNFASAHYGVAALHQNLGQRGQAEKYYQLALSKIDRMSDREKYRVRGAYYLFVPNHQKAIEEFSSLVQQYPGDTAGLANLGMAYYFRRDMARALAEGRRALTNYPGNALIRNNVAHYALYAGEFEQAAKEAQAVIQASPTYLKAYLAQALAELAQGKLAEAAATYGRLEATGPVGASFAASGLADLALYQGQPAEAAALLEKSIEVDLAVANAAAAGRKYVMLAQARLALGQKAQALAAADRAVAASKDVSTLFPAARLYIEAGQEAKARALAAELGKRLEADPQAYAKLIEGEILLKRGSAAEAIRSFQEAQKLADTWIGRFDLGRAYLAASAFPEADSELELCLKRRGEATEAYLNELPTYHYVPSVYYYLGRAQEGLKSPGAAESYKTFLAVKEKATHDPLVEEARRRLK
jgi:tetratricopeptide (TPR) repeat protein/predicted Ser/Thr protein kinase